jgi:hypothetical protein
MSSLKSVIENHPVVFYFMTIITAFGSGWGGLAGYQAMSKQVVLSQFEYALIHAPEQLVFEATQPPSVTLPASRYNSLITVTATSDVVAEIQAEQELGIKVNGKSVSIVKGHRGSKDTENKKISLVVSASQVVDANKEHEISLFVPPRPKGSPDTWAPKYTLKVIRKYDAVERTE